MAEECFGTPGKPRRANAPVAINTRGEHKSLMQASPMNLLVRVLPHPTNLKGITFPFVLVALLPQLERLS